MNTRIMNDIFQMQALLQLLSSIWWPNDRGVYITTYSLGLGLSHVCRYDLSLTVRSPNSMHTFLM